MALNGAEDIGGRIGGERLLGGRLVVVAVALVIRHRLPLVVTFDCGVLRGEVPSSSVSFFFFFLLLSENGFDES